VACVDDGRALRASAGGPDAPGALSLARLCIAVFISSRVGRFPSSGIAPQPLTL